jgi:enamine deaminase RidA (YjgF/YER057c/UK114 family)
LNNFSVDEKSLISINHNVYNTIFSNIKRKIISSNFKPTDLVRTWIYLNHIFSNYVEFNEARNKFFTENNIHYTANSNNLPASTGIEGRSSENSIVSIDCLLVDKSLSEPTIQRVYSNLQNEPDGVTYENKPSFARAVALKYQNRIELQISGTASIDNHGITVYENDPKNQIRTTLLSILHLLEQFGIGFSDFCFSTVFFKSANYYQIYKEVLKELDISEFSVSFVQTNVCRENLLFEIDGVCIKRIGEISLKQ